MIIETRAVGPFFKNGFILGCDETGEAALIDPGDEVAELLAIAARRQLTVRRILLTHAHVDHITGVAAAKAALGVPVHLHQADLFLYQNAVQQGALFGLPVTAPPPVDVFYSAGEVIAFGTLDVRPLHTPGHCPGGVCLQAAKRATNGDKLFVGDTLFAGSIGRTDLPGGDYETLIHSIKTVLFAFPDETEVFPGHGPSTTIGEERRTNPFLT
jgi:glyoxylase-like metal-dependent hydrolase (beta-lactamase superfamily II)